MRWLAHPTGHRPRHRSQRPIRTIARSGGVERNCRSTYLSGPTRSTPTTVGRVRWPYLPRTTPFGIAHRGGDTAAPENTLAAFEAAVNMGYTHLETDVHLTADGVLVAFHDHDLGRVTGRQGEIRDLTVSEIQSIEIGDGHRVPRMDELLEAFPHCHFNIDPKSDEAVEPLAALINDHEMVEKVCVGSFSDDRIAKIQRLLGERLCTSPGPRGVATVLAAAVAGSRWSPPYGCLQVPIRAYGLRLDQPWLIRRVQRLGMQVHFWTINDRSEMERLLDAGADAVITDTVETLVNVLTDRRAGVDPTAPGERS